MTDDNGKFTGDPADLLKRGGSKLFLEHWDRHAGGSGGGGDGGSGKGGRFIIQTAREFLAGFKPPDYLVDGIIQRSYLYSLTARTGHGKTAVSMALAQAVMRGLNLGGREVAKGSVLYLAGENPDDIRMRWLTLGDVVGFDPRELPLHFIAGVVPLKDRMVEIALEAQRIGDLNLVIVDTAAAYWMGDDPNNNAQQGEYARVLRQLTRLPGRPAVIVACHPVKNASRDNLLPVGGGAFLNEVDGNLTLWKDDETLSLHWQGKTRGPEFEPIAFRLEVKTSELVKDSKGRLLPTVVAHAISDIEHEAGEAKVSKDAYRLLEAIGTNAKASVSDLARHVGWMSAKGDPQKSKVYRVAAKLVEAKLVERLLDRYRLTEKGKREVGAE